MWNNKENIGRNAINLLNGGTWCNLGYASVLLTIKRIALDLKTFEIIMNLHKNAFNVINIKSTYKNSKSVNPAFTYQVTKLKVKFYYKRSKLQTP